VLSGTYWNAMGDDMEKGVALKPGSFFVLPANHIHHTWTTDKEGCAEVTCLPFVLESLIVDARGQEPKKREGHRG
jgi:hypothetical protein